MEESIEVQKRCFEDPKQNDELEESILDDVLLGHFSTLTMDVNICSYS